MPLKPLAPFKTPMRAAAAQVAQLHNIPAPVGGLNLRDPIAAMQPTDALVLNNMIPMQQGVELRKGWQVHTATVGGAVNSVFAYNAPNPTNNKVFAAAGEAIYDVTSGTATLSVGSTGATNGMWWTTQFSTGADTFLLAVSTTGGYWTYSTTSGWVKRTPTNLPTNPRTVGVWKRRLWFTCENDTNVYYMDAVNAITGTVTSFAVGSQLAHGGSVSALFSWTLDAGIGIDDHLVMVSTQGDLLVWKGTDPTDVTKFGLQGVWYIGPVPKYGKYFTPFGGDVMILSEFGLVPLGKLVAGQFNEMTPGPADKIQHVIGAEIAALRDTLQWDVFSIPKENIIVIKMPASAGVYKQYAMNVNTLAWCTFTGIPMNCSCVLDGNLYIGLADGRTARALYGDQDGVAIDGTGGDYIVGDVQCAFNHLGTPANNKKFDMARPIFVAPAAPSVKVLINVQYSSNSVAGSPSFNSITSAIWDTSLWNVSRWAGSTNTYQAWVGLAGFGYYGSLRMKVQGLPGTVFTSSHLMCSPGGVM